MQVKAKFIGEPNLGYEPGKNYVLNFDVLNGKIWIYPHDRCCLPCYYDTLRSFLTNWEVYE